MRSRTLKGAALAAMAGTMLQFGGCVDLEAGLQNVRIGFARELGAIPAQAVYDLTLGPIVDDFLTGGDDTGDGT